MLGHLLAERDRIATQVSNLVTTRDRLDQAGINLTGGFSQNLARRLPPVPAGMGIEGGRGGQNRGSVIRLSWPSSVGMLARWRRVGLLTTLMRGPRCPAGHCR